MQTSVTGNNSRLQGFTLIELIVALGIGALMVAVLPSKISALIDVVQYRSAVRDVVRAFESSRIEAVLKGRRQYLLVDVNSKKLDDGRGSTLQLPEAIALEVTALNGDGKGVLKFYFEPDGSTSGGSLKMLSAGRVSQIDLDWLTGQVQFR